ncbi:MAG: NAD-dependent epimerase/dehydratase family protein [Steroidobacteraceae bacterium]
MVCGSGLLAKAFSAFRDDDRVLIHAAGVSNSLETDARAFAREKARLRRAREEHPQKLLVYFGTCSADDPDRRETPYVAHKLEMEAFLERLASPWMVLRLPLAIGPGRRGRTLAPYLYERISRGEPFEVWENATRYPIDVVDALRIARRLIDVPAYWNRRINVALRAFPVPEFVRVMESIVGQPAVCRRVPKGRHYVIDCPEVRGLDSELALDYTERYLERVLRKYFAG